MGAFIFFQRLLNLNGNNFTPKNHDVICVFCLKDFKQVYHNWNILEYLYLFVIGLTRIEYIIEKARYLS